MGCVLLASEQLNNELFNRVKSVLPVIDGRQASGLNRRYRIYRYKANDVYRVHIDGAWPGSGIDEQGQYVYNYRQGEWSRLTFILYLNQTFQGGHTTFFTPLHHSLLAQGVTPVQGNVLCFPHGDNVNSLVHEGSPVQQGVKYIIRTDVLYPK